jgi:rhamnogalacturonyl hydrolase YesR/lysophospholipase L1-like esterase
VKGYITSSGIILKSYSPLRMKTVLSLAIAVFLLSFQTKIDHPTLYIIGDSTVKTGKGTGADSLWGWGSFLPVHFDTLRLDIQNHAIGGRSSRTFLTDGRWDKILTTLKTGDFILIQFGHNDASPLDDTARARGTLRGIGEADTTIFNPIKKQSEKVYTYGWYLRKYLREAKAKGAIPIVCSPVPRHQWTPTGKVKRADETYGLWAKQVADTEGVAFLDLNDKIAEAYEALGEAAVKQQFFPKDNTHTDYDGARFNAQMVANEIRALVKCPLTLYLKPVLPVFDKTYIRNTLLKVAEWQLKNPKHVLTDWTNGAFYTGVFAAYETTQSKTLRDSLWAMGERNQWLPHRRFDHADDIVISQTYIDLYRLQADKRMIQATIDSIAKIWTTKGNETTKHGITWWWCDALFMAPPTLAKLAKSVKTPHRSSSDGRYLALNDSLFKECYDLLYDKSEHLFFRDASYLIDAQGKGKREGNGQKIFWSRGNGWVMAGLARLLKELPMDYPKRPFYLQLFKDMAAKIQSLQQADGLWRSSLLDPLAYPGGEGSGSGFYCYALSYGINAGILDSAKYTPAVKKAWIGLNSLLSEEGRVGWVQPIGADPRRNFSADSWEVFGTGAFLLAGSEIIKLQ